VNARVPNLDLLQLDEAASAALDEMFARVWAELAPPAELSIIEWAEKYRQMSPEETALPGRYEMEHTPALRGILAAASDPNVRKIIVQKSAQVGYTAGVVCNVIGYHIHWRPSVQVAMFPREKSAKDFAAEKLEPMIKASPALAERVNLKSRASGQGATRRSYTGGLLKLVASNSPSDVKSTSGRVGIVEEPDDTNKDVGGQGNAIVLLGERTKTYAPDDLQLIGGTPTAKATSLIVKEMRDTDQRHFMVPCHECGESHALEWENVIVPGLRLTDEELALPKEELDARWPEREVYGRARWEDAFYNCPHCGAVWTDDERIANIRRAAQVPPYFGFLPTAESSTPGFYLTELLSTFDGSRLPLLARKYLTALHEYNRGEPEKMVAFWNSTLGLPWEYRGELPEEDELRERALQYAEWSSPAGGLMPLLTVDVQHDRLACTVWVIGPGEEMWLAYWGELHGRTIVSHQGAWLELEALLTKTVRHASGVHMPIAAVAIDSGDGQTSEAVYDFVRLHHRRVRPVLAVKGASDRVGRIEIWTRPKAIDPNRKGTKASKHGVHSHQVGTAKAKDLILGWAQEGGRVRLAGSGPGRMHWYEGVRDDFYEQLLGEMKIPSRYNPRIREWTERTDRRNEALDCTVYAVWLCRYLGLHLKKPAQWAAIKSRLLQASLIDTLVDDVEGDAVEDGQESAGQPPALPSPSGSSVAQAPVEVQPQRPPPPLPSGRISLGGAARFRGAP
jgi:phage terminase large subunit GpA-like protein